MKKALVVVAFLCEIIAAWHLNVAPAIEWTALGLAFYFLAAII